VLLGDPGRAYRPRERVDELARYLVPTSLDLEGADTKEAVVWRVLPG
jgi:predicted nicotinamide N-methyase